MEALLSKFKKPARVEMMQMYERNIKEADIRFNIKKVGISTGLFVPLRMQDWKTAMERADDAQEAAKSHGKNQIRIYYSAYYKHMKKKKRPQSDCMAPADML